MESTFEVSALPSTQEVLRSPPGVCSAFFHAEGERRILKLSR